MNSTVKLGPLVAGTDDCRVLARSGTGAVFSRMGLHLWDEDGETQLQWRNIVDLKVSAPTAFSSLPVVPYVLQLISPVNMRMPFTYVYVVPDTGKQMTVNLGRPPAGPFDYRDLDLQEAVIDRLQERGRLDLLGSGHSLQALLREVARIRTFITPLAYRRANKIVERFLEPV